MKNLVLLCAALIALAASSSAQQATAPAKTVFIKCGRLIDGRADAPRESMVIRIAGNRIEEVGAGVVIPTGSEIIDLSGATVLPGLIDAHTHVLLQGDVTEEDYAEQILKDSIPYRAYFHAKKLKLGVVPGMIIVRKIIGISHG